MIITGSLRVDLLAERDLTSKITKLQHRGLTTRGASKMQSAGETKHFHAYVKKITRRKRTFKPSGPLFNHLIRIKHTILLALSSV
jgi:hypothetical protein